MVHQLAQDLTSVLTSRPCRYQSGQLPRSPFDRHRGGGHPPTPATPPCVRVRTRRFELVTLTPIDQRKTAICPDDETARTSACVSPRSRDSVEFGELIKTASGLPSQLAV